MNPPRIAFMGSPAFSVDVLHALHAKGYEIACVYTQPPRRAGRGKKLTLTPVHAAADALGLEVRHPTSLKSDEEAAAFAALNLDAAVVVAYGLILPQRILDAPKHGCINLHASLLPRWRGAAPIERAIMAGDAETGVEAMIMEAGLDTGPVLLTKRTAIAEDDTGQTLHDRLAEIGAAIAPLALQGHIEGSLTAIPQLKTGMIYAKKLTATDQIIDWTRPAEEIDRQIRGLSPGRCAYFNIADGDKPNPTRVKLILSTVEDIETDAAPGTLLEDGFLIACGTGAVRILRGQKSGKGPMDGKVLLQGLPLKIGHIIH